MSLTCTALFLYTKTAPHKDGYLLQICGETQLNQLLKLFSSLQSANPRTCIDKYIIPIGEYKMKRCICDILQVGSLSSPQGGTFPYALHKWLDVG